MNRILSKALNKIDLDGGGGSSTGKDSGDREKPRKTSLFNKQSTSAKSDVRNLNAGFVGTTKATFDSTTVLTESSAPKTGPNVTEQRTESKKLELFFGAEGFPPPECVPCLPNKLDHHQEKVTLILDVDETLVHTKIYNVGDERLGNHSHAFQFQLENYVFCVHERPFLRTFLEWAAQHFELVAFSAGKDQYIYPVLERIDPERQYFTHVLTRKHCICMNDDKLVLKDLSMLNRSLERLMLVDNSATSFLLQPNNGIPILSWYGDYADTSLLTLKTVLHDLNQVNGDLRPILRERFLLEKILLEQEKQTTNSA